MNNSTLLPSLNLMTLLVFVVIVGIGFAWFMRKRSNRHPLRDDEGFENNRRPDEPPRP